MSSVFFKISTKKNQKKKGKWLGEKGGRRTGQVDVGLGGGVMLDRPGKVKDGKDGDGNIKKIISFLISSLSQQAKTCTCAIILLTA